MTKFFKTTLSVAAATSLLFSCNQFKVTEDPDGSKYQIHEAGKGKKIKTGDMLTFDLVIKSSIDSTFEDTYKRKQPITMVAQPGLYKGSFENALMHLTEGDSATVFVNADSLFTRMGQTIPPGITKGSDLKFIVKIKSTQTREDFQKAQNEKKNNEAKLMEEFAKKNFPNATKTQYGIYHTVVKEGTGDLIKAGQVVTVDYTGKLMNGKVFDSSVGKPGPKFQVTVGQGAVIPGWEQALLLMKKGEKSIIFIPSSLAYGEQGGGPIEPFSSLIFEMEILDVK
ncbi:peptidylprolyl isomerase FKBP-type [Emticicia oligotrophica DSM 17448]|uniref:Peptidyl-prolyl cis-trans isomerase n=1 Tax=Emticicia oligotrophica (strain DSM 17448 / CIP 109782 / MTCC 6937 / GPTSA100-15) TaxID=929562 RepID=A0ABN4ANK4_EMTOG|nr:MULTISPECIES: FKBP-type peptidyl-prolyl cis-trans isomerase [Emticicia]AFK03905.1 peptidylprolyl isomerase FKBP-type [Emticicia oligotrophica DSM 17448]